MEKYFEDKQTKDGGFGTNNRESHYNQWNLSGVGILGLQTMGKGKSATVASYDWATDCRACHANGRPYRHDYRDGKFREGLGKLKSSMKAGEVRREHDAPR